MTTDGDTCPDGHAENSDGFEPIRTECLGGFSELTRYVMGMAPSPAQVLALVVVTTALLAPPLAAAPTDQQTATDGATGSPTDPGPGAHLAGVVAVQNSTVDAAVASGTFQARLANATTDSERATVIDRRLGAIERRLAAARSRSRELSRARAEGSLSEDRYAARAAALAATADRLAGAGTATEQTGRSLPADRRAAIGVAERAAEIRTEARRLREQTSDAAAAIDGSREESHVEPVSAGAVEDIFDQVAGAETPFTGVASSERMNVHVRRANGTTPVFAVRIENGRVTAVDDDPFENPTLSVSTDYRVLDRVRRADDPAGAIRTAIENDRIRYDGRGLGNSLKYGAIKLASLLRP
jgi:hypothetical protein